MSQPLARLATPHAGEAQHSDVMWGHFWLDRGLARAGAPGPSPFSRVTVSPVAPVSLSIPPPLQLAPSHVSSLSLGLVGGFSSILRVSSRVPAGLSVRVCASEWSLVALSLVLLPGERLAH